MPAVTPKDQWLHQGLQQPAPLTQHQLPHSHQTDQMPLAQHPTRPPMGPEPEFVEIEAKAVLAGLGRS